MVVTASPSTSPARVMHASTALPLTKTVHVPHSDSSQAVFVPVKPKRSRKTSSSFSCPLRSSWYCLLLIVNVVMDSMFVDDFGNGVFYADAKHMGLIFRAACIINGFIDMFKGFVGYFL